MIVLTQPQIESIKAGLIPTDIPLHFREDVEFMIDVQGSCLIAIWPNNDADVIEEEILSDEEFAEIEQQATLIRLR